MNEPKLRARLLTHLFDRCQATETIDLIDLARGAGASVKTVLSALGSLERAGLVDARALRLTLPGLAVAVAFAQGRREDERASPRPGRPLPTGRHAA